MAVTRDEILDALKQKGPMVPNAIKKIVGGDTIILGAMLAELSSRKLVKISNVKRGGSPFYYLPGQEPQLEACMEYLPEKELRTAHFLKERRVVADRELELYHRVAMRQLKDFAKEFKAQTNQGEVLFWRYFLVSEQEAVAILNERNKPPTPQPAPIAESEPVMQPVESQPEPAPKPQSESVAVMAEPTLENEVLPTPAKQQPISQEAFTSESIPQPVESGSKQVSESQPVPVVQSESVAELVDVTDYFEGEAPIAQSTASSKPVKKKTVSTKKVSTTKKEVVKEESSQDNSQETIQIESTEFLEQCRTLFAQKNIVIESIEENKKNKEYDFVAKVPSAFGSLKMFIRAKDKKRLNEGDVAPALLRAKKLDLQCLFLTTGQFTKKSLSLIEEEYSGVIIEYFSN